MALPLYPVCRCSGYSRSSAKPTATPEPQPRHPSSRPAGGHANSDQPLLSHSIHSCVSPEGTFCHQAPLRQGRPQTCSLILIGAHIIICMERGADTLAIDSFVLRVHNLCARSTLYAAHSHVLQVSDKSSLRTRTINYARDEIATMQARLQLRMSNKNS